MSELYLYYKEKMEEYYNRTEDHEEQLIRGKKSNNF
jgi:hypothetical protein